MRVSKKYVCLLAACVTATNLGIAQGVKVDKLLAFATSNEVRVVCSIAAATELGTADVRASITQAGTGRLLWEGALASTKISAGKAATVSKTIPGLTPRLWEPTSPVLYNLRVSVLKHDQGTSAGGPILEASTRFGFRSMEVANGHFYLNGRPIFLRGVAINPPGRGIPDSVGETRAFAESYVRFLKSQNVNIFRITTDESQVWFDVCDELGMMLYAGRYGAPPGADEGKRVAPTDFDRIIAGYKQLFEHYASHPSIVAYLLANELPVSGSRGAAFSKLLTRAHAELKQWDPTRPIIGNAGYGEGREGDVCDAHRYWGWYYNSFLTYYNLRDKLVSKPLFGDPQKNQPLTFTECVGSFTGPLGQFNVVRSKQLAPQLGWIGHTATPREDALEYQSFMVGQATESFRRMRPINPRLAGIMPFSIFFYNWSDITSFDQMQPKPAMSRLATAYQPVLLSWEFWTPQVYGGSLVNVAAHVVNDSDNGERLPASELVYFLRSKSGRLMSGGKTKVPPIPYFGTLSLPVRLSTPEDAPEGEYDLCGSINASGTIVATNSATIYLGKRNSEAAALLKNPVALYDPRGSTAESLKKLHIPFRRIDQSNGIPGMGALIIGEEAWDQGLSGKKDALKKFVAAGGRILCLRQSADRFDASWLPQEITMLESSPNAPDYPPKTRPFREQMNVNFERPGHAVFRGLDQRRVKMWSDYTGWDQTKPGFPKVYPVTGGFKLLKAEALAATAILADYDRGLEASALAEFFEGKGSVILSGFDLAARIGLDPATDRLLVNLVSYVSSAEGHDIHPLIARPILWGDYATECGTVCGSLNGLLVNCEWVPSALQKAEKAFPPNTGSWNMAPGEQFVPHGRNPFGPYSYTTGSSLKDLSPDSDSGTGFFWASIPPGKKQVVTTVHNPGARPASFSCAVNQESKRSLALAPGEKKELRADIGANARTVHVVYAGSKTVVILETRFE